MFIKLSIATGNDFQLVLTALMQRREDALDDAITSLGPDKDYQNAFFENMRDIEALDNMILQMVTALNEKAGGERQERDNRNFDTQKEYPNAGKGLWRRMSESVAENFKCTISNE